MPENTSNPNPPAQDTHGASILLDEVTKSYSGQRKPAVGGLTLEIPSGSVVMFVGPSGCGKTTTLKMINRLIEPTAGKIVINGEDVTDMDGDKLRRQIGYVIQAGGLFPHMTVAANIALVPKMLGWDKARIKERVDELLELVSLDPDVYRNRYPKELSGGQQQRVGVARALAADPPVLLMDEPCSALDPISTLAVEDLINELKNDYTIVIVTHNMQQASRVSDRTGFFNIAGTGKPGHLIEIDDTDTIFTNPSNKQTEDYISGRFG